MNFKTYYFSKYEKDYDKYLVYNSLIYKYYIPYNSFIKSYNKNNIKLKIGTLEKNELTTPIYYEYFKYHLNNKYIDYNIFISYDIFSDLILSSKILKYKYKKNKNKLMNVYDFIKYKNYKLEYYNYFNEIWESLKDKKEILITKDLLDFIGYKNVNNIGLIYNFNKNIKILIKLLNKYKIDYLYIDITHPKALLYPYIQNKIKNNDNDSIHFKKWLLLSINSFKELLLLCNNKSKNIIKYLIQIEEIFTEYIKYNDELNINNKKTKYRQKIKYLIDKYEKQLKIKDNEINYNNITTNLSKSNKSDIIYIMTTLKYQNKNIFKIGGIKRDLLKYKLSTYNNKILIDYDKYFYIYYSECIDYKSIKYQFSIYFESHKYKKNKDLYQLSAEDIIIWIEKFISNENCYIDLLNNVEYRKQLYNNVINVKSNFKQINIDKINNS